MIQLIFSIYDEKAKAFLPPFFMHTAGMATRTFTDMINDDTCAFNKHPEDYTLFKLGTFNDSTAKIELEQSAHPLHNGVTLINPELDNAHEIGNDSSILPSSKS